MKLTSFPLNEELRLQDLHEHDILDSDAEKDFDDLLEVVTQLLNCKMAAISFMDRDRQWFKSKQGFTIDEAPRSIAFCEYTIVQPGVLIVEDTVRDERFSNNPLVTGEFQIRFYAGAPIISAGGFALGTVCVLDHQPKILTSAQEGILQIVSSQCSRLLELRLKNKVLKRRATAQLQTEKRLLDDTLRKQETERTIISRELHEDIAQSLAAVKFYLEMAAQHPEKTTGLIEQSRTCVSGLLEQVRNLSQAISPSTLREVNLADMLQALRNRFRHQTGLAVSLSYRCTEELPADTSLVFYRIVEEQLENIRLHAQATQVSIELTEAKTICLLVRDNGVGLNTTNLYRGTGLRKILSWTEAQNGSAEVHGQPGKGCVLEVHLPCPQLQALPASSA